MIGSLKDWLLALSVRERLLIAILGVLIIGVIGFYGIAKPFWYALDNAEQEYTEAVKRQARIETKVAALSQPVDVSIKPIAGGFATFVSQSAGETGFAIGKMDAQADGRINLTVESARPGALFGWLSQLEARAITVEALDVTPLENSTITANLTLRSNAQN